MYKAIIGLEVHCELKTNSKNFSSAPNKFSTYPNEYVATVDLGLPGILPVINKEACRKALLTAMALNCTNPDVVLFDRKNYFYPDLPKGYQITQVTKPMGKNGYLDILLDGKVKRVLIHQLHLEEDTASLEHHQKYSLIDYNRSGVPLIEIVTEPCIESAEEAVIFLEDLRDLFLYLEVSDAKSNYGQMRCDVNISLKEENSDTLGTKVEMKNINAFNNVKAAIEYEIKRQSEILSSGGKVIQETRRIAEDGKTYAMREKVDAVDYKYFVEPNIPPVKLEKEYLEELRKSLPKLKLERYFKYIDVLKINEEDAKALVRERCVSDYFDKVLEKVNNLALAVNFMMGCVLSTLNKQEISINDLFIREDMLSELINYVDQGKLSLDHGKKIFFKALEEKVEPSKLIEKENLKQINNENELLDLIKRVMDENSEQVRQYVEEGNIHVYNFFVGQVMKASNRQANPNKSLEIIKEELERRKK